MTLLEYIKLDETSKNELILEKGMLLDVYTENDNRTSLFSLHSFFVEVIINDKEGRIIDVMPYESNFRFGLRQKEKTEAHNSLIRSLNYYFLT
jgi:hypothetical protein